MGDSKIRLAILDDYQGVSTGFFARLESRVAIESFPQTLNPSNPVQKAALIARLQPFTVISTMRERTPLPSDVILALPNLRLILTTGIFNDSIAISTCAGMGIIVAGTTGIRTVDKSTAKAKPSLSYQSTTQHTWALILGITRNITYDDLTVKHGGWQTGFATGLSGKTLGVLGLGRLGVMTAKVAILAFDMKVLAWSSSLTQADADEKAAKYGLSPGSFCVANSKEELFRSADILSLHYVLSERSRGLVGAKELELMKSTAFLVNTSRGALIDERALLNTLKKGAIKGAAIDVFETEPLPSDSEWRTTKWGENGISRCLITPHMGYVEESTVHAWYDEQAETTAGWLDGREPTVKLN